MRSFADKNGKLVDLHGKISLEGYQMVHFSGITFDGTDKRVMEKTSYMELRQAIGTWRQSDKNISD